MDKIQRFKSCKNPTAPLVCLTAYTAPMARSVAPYVDLILVGDSMGTTIYGMESTQDVSVEMMCAHGAAVRRGAPEALIIVDMPHGSYEEGDEQALENAKLIMEKTGADGVKLEGGVSLASRVETITKAGIAVMGHIGLLPQSAPDEGGYKIKGKTDKQIQNLINDAQIIEKSGAFSIVIEGTFEEAGARVTQSVTIPTIGIGASGACDGQILVTEDLLGMLYGHRPKFAPNYGHLSEVIEAHIEHFADDVRARTFPRKENLYGVKS